MLDNINVAVRSSTAGLFLVSHADARLEFLEDFRAQRLQDLLRHVSKECNTAGPGETTQSVWCDTLVEIDDGFMVLGITIEHDSSATEDSLREIVEESYFKIVRETALLLYPHRRPEGSTFIVDLEGIVGLLLMDPADSFAQRF